MLAWIILVVSILSVGDPFSRDQDWMFNAEDEEVDADKSESNRQKRTFYYKMMQVS
jgi:hypothetical protein